MSQKELGKHKKHRRFIGFYTKTGIIMSLTVVLGFILLAFSYYSILASSLNASRLTAIKNAALSFEQLCQKEEVYDQTDLFRLEGKLTDRLKVVAEATDSYVWLVNYDGEIIFASAIPESLQKELSRSMRSRNFMLPKALAGGDLSQAGISYKHGNYHGLFNQAGGKWLSFVKPLYNIYGSQLGIIQIHSQIDPWRDLHLYLFNGLALTLIIAAIVAMILVFSFLHQISKPLRSLSKVARKVALGDFEARVNLPQYTKEDFDLDSVINEDDDIGNLVYTFNNMIEQLQNNNTAQRDFIASISHDLKTPLTSINGFVTGLLDGVIPKEQAEHYLKIVKSECARMVKLVSEINLMMQLENNQVTYNFVSFDINTLISEVIVSQEPQINEKNLTIQTDLATKAGHGIKVEGDREKIQRVLQNLLQNAIKFTPKDGIIAISTDLPKGQKNFVQIHVDDSGSGIPDHELNLVFDRFYKADRSRTGKGGSGLGLFICKTILAAHGQQITARRSSLGGAGFVFTLPLS